MTHPDGKEASHPDTPRSRPGRAGGAKSKADASAQAVAAGYEPDDESLSAAAEDAAWDEENAALPEPVHATGAGGAAALSDDVEDDGDETALPFLYDDENDDGAVDDEADDEEDEDGGEGAADDFGGINQELADQQALLRRAGEILGSLGREPVTGADDEEEEDGEFQWADEDDPEEQVTLVDEEWLQRVASHAVRRVTARAEDMAGIEASADPDAIRPLPAKLELTLLEPALAARVQSPVAPAMRQDRTEHGEQAGADTDENEDSDDESELVPLLAEAAYEAAVAEAEAAGPAVEAEVGTFAPSPDEEPEPAVLEEPSAEWIEQGGSGIDPTPTVIEAGDAHQVIPTDDSDLVPHPAEPDPDRTPEHVAADDPDGEYHALMLEGADAAPAPGAFEDFAARGGRIANGATLPEDCTGSTVTPSVTSDAITVTASGNGADPLAGPATEINTVLLPQVTPTPELVISAEPVALEHTAAIPEQQPADGLEPAAEPPRGQEFAVTPGFDIAEALAPEPEHGTDTAADEGIPADEFNDIDGESGGWEGDGDEPLAYESAEEPALAGRGLRGGGWTIPLLCLGIGLIACCLLIPLADSNRRLAYERQRLGRDLESIQTQVAVNDEFLRRVHDDPSLAERLAQRQMKTIRQGTRVLELDRTRRGSSSSAADMSPFQLVAVQPPAPLPPYRPLSGTIANLCYRPRSRLYLMGVGLFMMACGLVLGYTPKRG